MKKLTLSIGLVAAMLSTKSQDTTNIMVTKDKIYYFEKNVIKPYKQYFHNNNIFFYTKENECLRLHLYDKKYRTRKLTTIYKNGEITINILDSKDNLYLSPLGPFKLKIGKSKFIQKL